MYRKKSPEKFSKVFEKALSYFPELKDAYIFIHEKSLFGVQHTLRAYPPFVVLHWKKQNWVCPIVINNNKSKNLSFYDMSEDEQIGALVHELSHISVYIKCSRMDIANLYMYKYATNKTWVRNMEKETDLRVIAKGAGVYLFEARLHWLLFRIKNTYKETQDTYMLPDEFINELRKFPDLYTKEEIFKLNNELQALKIMPNYKQIIQNKISLMRRIKHAFKTIYCFFPEFIQMVYLVPIKKIHK